MTEPGASQLEQELYVWKKLKQAGFEGDGPGLEPGPAPGDDPEPEPLTEGERCMALADRYERNPAARRACIEAHGTTCAICGFDFAKAYGPQFAGIIQVHHITPLHKIGQSHVVDPVRALIPVCPNCHVALHSKPGGGTYTPDELRNIMGQGRGCRQ